MRFEDHRDQVGLAAFVVGDQVGRQRAGGQVQAILQIYQVVARGEQRGLHPLQLALAGVEHRLDRSQPPAGVLEPAAGGLDPTGLGGDLGLQRGGVGLRAGDLALEVAGAGRREQTGQQHERGGG
ncbi:MAG: hypothetical protein JO206_09035 [Solirubrobacterales bacterium]|nr:hypothetical protein [Solirubrobacterales bacterium]MBV9473102.1 hypothetical protein [Solirubrobacterales bacterium]